MSDSQLTHSAKADSLQPLIGHSIIEREDGWVQTSCEGCCHTKGMYGTPAQSQFLLEYLGWVFGAQILCSECAHHRAQKFIRRYAE